MSISRRMPLWLAIWAVLAIHWGAEAASGQFGAPAQSSRLQLPGNPDSWINSPPLSTELLKGKAAVFYLFEEG